MRKWLLLLILVSVAAGFWYLNTRPREIELTLYFGDENAEFLRPETRRVQISPGESKLAVAVTELIKGPTEPGLTITIPEGTRLLGLEVKDNVAWVNFSREIQTRHWGGSAGEMLTTFSVVNTLTEFPEVQAVQFQVEGKVLDSIWGHGVTDEPIGRNPDLIAPGE
ncbi:MAG: GerMN domain-containing protein [Firmicutes bacterium]|nr:GerMN domain-containing protein [Bacillota bacterium]